MALSVRYKHPSGTRAGLNSLAAANGLKVGEIYLITDENRIAVGLTTSTYQDFAKLSEAGGSVTGTKVSALPAVTTPAGSDVFPCVQGGVSKGDTRDDMSAYVAAPIFAVLGADYTLTSTTAVQKLFNVSTNGAVTITPGLYWMELDAQITGMSSTTGNGAFSLAGTAVLANPRLLHSYGLDATAQTTAANLSGEFIQGGTTFTGPMAVTATGTALGIAVRGLLACTTGGTIIPSFALTTAAAAAVVKAGSCFTLERLGAATDTIRGNWS